MATFSYTGKDITDFESLVQALESEGVDITKARCTLSEGNVTINADDCDQTQADDAVANAAVDTLHSRQVDAIRTVQAKSDALAAEGVYFTRDSVPGETGPLDLSYKQRGQIRDLQADVQSGAVVLPQVIDTPLNGRGVLVFTEADIDAAYDAIIARGVYLLGAAAPGQGYLIQEINAATSIAGVNAVLATDTRE